MVVAFVIAEEDNHRSFPLEVVVGSVVEEVLGTAAVVGVVEHHWESKWRERRLKAVAAPELELVEGSHRTRCLRKHYVGVVRTVARVVLRKDSLAGLVDMLVVGLVVDRKG